MAVTRFFVPPPVDKILIAVDAILLALSALFIRGIGAMYVGVVGGTLTSLLRPGLIPFSIIYTFLFGAMVDASLFLFKVKATGEGVNRNRLMMAMAAVVRISPREVFLMDKYIAVPLSFDDGQIVINCGL